MEDGGADPTIPNMRGMAPRDLLEGPGRSHLRILPSYWPVLRLLEVCMWDGVGGGVGCGDVVHSVYIALPNQPINQSTNPPPPPLPQHPNKPTKQNALAEPDRRMLLIKARALGDEGYAVAHAAATAMAKVSEGARKRH